jgi:hypothetical protein
MWPDMASAIPCPGPKPLLLILFGTVRYYSTRPEPYLQFHSSPATGWPIEKIIPQSVFYFELKVFSNIFLRSTGKTISSLVLL